MVFNLHTEGTGKGVPASCYTTTAWMSFVRCSKDFFQVIRDVTPMVLSRALKLCNFLDWKDIKVKYVFAQSFALL